MTAGSQPATTDEFFEDFAGSRSLYEALAERMQTLGPVTVKVTKSQIAFCRKRAFAWAWVPEQYLRRKAAPLVLSISLAQRDPSPRWKQVVEPARGRFMHHLELYDPADIDAQVLEWLRAAWKAAG